MKTKLLFLALGLISTALFSQNTSLDWAVRMGGLGNEIGYSITTDKKGNIYATGTFSGTVDFDPGPDTFNLTSAGLTDIYIQKLDAEGGFLWAIKMGGRNLDAGYSIATDSNGNIYTTGLFRKTVDFAPGDSTLNFTSAGGNDIFIQKLDSNGTLVWVKQIGDKLHDGALSIATDAQGNVYITGSFQGTVDFDPGDDTLSFTSKGSFDVFVQKLNTNGDLIWAKQMGGGNFDRGNAVTTDKKGNVYVTGNFTLTVDFDPDSGTTELTAVDRADAFVQKLDSNGALVWVKQIAGSANDIAYSTAIDNQGNVYTTGYFQNSAEFNFGSKGTRIASLGKDDIFVQKLDAKGTLIWVKQMGGSSKKQTGISTSNNLGKSIIIDAKGEIYTTGYFSDTVDFDPGVDTMNLISAGAKDFFLQKLDTNGNLIWVEQLGDSAIDEGFSLTMDKEGNLYTIGTFTHTIDFDFGSDTFNLTSVRNQDIFIQKLIPKTVIVTTASSPSLHKASLFPNPTRSKVNILLGGMTNVSLKIVNLKGAVVYQKANLNGKSYSFDLKVAKGVYLVELISNYKRQQHKLIIE